MIKIENTKIVGWEAAIRGMRNPKNSWDRSDSVFVEGDKDIKIGPNDHKLMMTLTSGGPVHAKYRRFIDVYVDITAPLYWWKEFDTYKVGTVANSCSTMHKIHAKSFELSDFSCEHLIEDADDVSYDLLSPMSLLGTTIGLLNQCRDAYLETKDKRYWWQMIQLLPSSYNQKRTIMMNYEVLANIYKSRNNHKLDEWKNLCRWIEYLPYSELSTGKE